MIELVNAIEGQSIEVARCPRTRGNHLSLRPRQQRTFAEAAKWAFPQQWAERVRVLNVDDSSDELGFSLDLLCFHYIDLSPAVNRLHDFDGSIACSG